MVKLYLDENVNVLLASLLRARNIEVSTTLESNMLGTSDEEQLDYATSRDAALVTHNRVDFENLFQKYIESSKRTSGIVILIRRDVYTMAQRLSRFCLVHKDITGQLFYV